MILDLSSWPARGLLIFSLSCLSLASPLLHHEARSGWTMRWMLPKPWSMATPTAPSWFWNLWFTPWRSRWPSRASAGSCRIWYLRRLLSSCLPFFRTSYLLFSFRRFESLETALFFKDASHGNDKRKTYQPGHWAFSGILNFITLLSILP